MPTAFLSNLFRKITGARTKKTSPHNDDVNDLSYEDAVLDVEIRSFFRSEYKNVTPPAGVFSRVLSAIRHREIELENGSYLGRYFVGAFKAIYRIGAGADIGRVLSTGLVAVLFVVATGPSLSRVINSEPESLGNLSVMKEEVNDTSSTTGIQHPQVSPSTRPDILVPADQTIPASERVLQHRLLVEQRTGENFNAPPEPQQMAELDPAEYLAPSLRPATDRTKPRYLSIIEGPE